MNELPPELVLQVYQACTPNRKKALLATCKQISSDVRPWVTRCTANLSGGLLPHAPEVDRFSRLDTIHLTIDRQQPFTLNASLGEVELEADGDIIFTLAPGRNVVSIEGFRVAYFDVSKAVRIPESHSIFRLCKKLEKASFFGDHGETVEVGELRNDWVRHLQFQNATFTTLRTPALETLEMEVRDRSVYVNCTDLPGLTSLKIHAKALWPVHPWSTTLVSLTVHLTRHRAVLLQNLPLLQKLHLVNVTGQMGHVDNCPDLHWLKLDNSNLDDAPPDEIVAAAALHRSLMTLEIVAPAPSALDIQEWGLLQKLYGAYGFCHYTAIRLCFEF